SYVSTAQSPTEAGSDIVLRRLHQSPGLQSQARTLLNCNQKAGVVVRRCLQARRSASEARTRPLPHFAKSSVSDCGVIVETRLPDEAAARHSQRIEHEGLHRLCQGMPGERFERLDKQNEGFAQVLETRPGRE